MHVNERRFRCGECGKLYKTIAHVKGHRRVHSDERPYSCPTCGKRYKTKVCLPPSRLAFSFLSRARVWEKSRGFALEGTNAGSPASAVIC